MSLKKLCRCGVQIDAKGKCCSKCAPHYALERAKYNKQYDTTKRKNAEFYSSTEWIKLRGNVLIKSAGLDLYDYFVNGKVTKAKTVHHIVELKDDYSKGLDILNLIPLSSSNHSKIHRMYFRNKVKAQQMLFDVLEKARATGLAA
jgi:hypothetical protein